MQNHSRLTIDADVRTRFTACYLRVAGDECAFIESHTAHAVPRLLAALELQGKTPNDVYLAGDFGHLRHWNGTQFSLVRTTITKVPVTAAFYAMWGTSSTDLWIVGDEIALHKTDPTHP